MVTVELLRAAHDDAIASLDPAQRAAVDRMFEARCQSTFTGAAVERRLDRIFRHEAAGLNEHMSRGLQPA